MRIVEERASTSRHAPDGAVAAASTRRVYAFFCKHVDDTINVHGEAQMVMQNLLTSPWWRNFELNALVMPTFDNFDDVVRNCTLQNVVLVYFAGHTGKGGELCFCKNKTGSVMEMLGPDFVAPCIAGSSKNASTRARGGTIECVVLNSCHTRALGLALRDRGVMHVVCWHRKVNDATAAKFAEEFFKELVVHPTDYAGAFEAGCLEVRRCDPRAADACVCMCECVHMQDILHWLFSNK